jgi:hypothetical protein
MIRVEAGMTESASRNLGEKWDIPTTAKALKVSKGRVETAVRRGWLPVRFMPGGYAMIDPYDAADWYKSRVTKETSR